MIGQDRIEVPAKGQTESLHGPHLPMLLMVFHMEQVLGAEYLEGGLLL